MNWTTALIIAAVVAALYAWKKASQVSSRDARKYLQQGALVIDVRSPAEFKSGHLPPVVNIPLGEIEALLPRRVKDKNQVLLLHCHSGMRSAAATKKSKKMGYSNTFNLGSYSRAKSILKSSR